MTGSIITIPRLRFIGANGAPLASGTLSVYLAGTTTPATTWQDKAMTVANTNPIVLDGLGSCVVWLDSTKTYKIVLKNKSGVIQWTQDNIVGGGVDSSYELTGSLIEAAQAAAEASAAAALASLNDFKGRWYGALSADPSVDPLGNPVNAGDGYWNTALNQTRIYSGSAWNAAFTPGDSSGVTYLPSGTGAVATTVQAKLRESVSVKDFGAVGDGVADDSAAFAAAIAYANSISLAPSVININRSGKLKIYVPAGRYRLTQPIIKSTDFAAGRTVGLAFEGDGSYLTEIVYEPSGSIPLFYNNDKVLFLRISGITFYANSATTDWMYSYSTGGAQDYRFQDCVWTGVWQYGLRLKGTNTNSEFSFEKSGFFGSWTVFLFSEDSDQFLNYWFTECKYWCNSPWMKFTKGGNIKISNCDVSGYQPTVETYLFRLEGTTHGSGVCSFVCHATRFELKSTNAKIIYSEWSQGNILFSGCDTESQTSLVAAFNTAYFTFVNVPGPVIQWINCSLMGTHTYAAGGSNQFQYIPRISYDNCFITQFAKPEDFLIRTHSVNYGGRPVAKFYNCRGNSGASVYEVFDSDQGWADAARSLTSRKIVKVSGSNQAGPISGATESVLLPLNAVIVKVWMVNIAGSTGNSGAFNFVMRTGEATPTVLGQATGANLSLGYNVTNDVFFRCNSDAKRTINVVDLQSITNTGANYFLIEYIG